jgi:putative FmdB family regulatory protein
MPTYGYRCESCGHEFEVQQKMSDAPLKTCPKCAGKLSKKMYAAGIVFKGSGFYKTDYQSAGQAADKAADKTAAKGSDKGESNGAAKPSEGSGGTSSAAETKTESKSPKSDSNREKAS